MENQEPFRKRGLIWETRNCCENQEPGPMAKNGTQLEHRASRRKPRPTSKPEPSLENYDLLDKSILKSGTHMKIWTYMENWDPVEKPGPTW